MAKTLYPYWAGHCWVFDDPATNLTREAFVMGISEMISRLVSAKGITTPRDGFSLSFDAEPFDGFDTVVDWQREGDHPEQKSRGNWYAGEIAGEWMEGWLCPALFEYFPAAPRRIFVRCEPLPAGVSPRWESSAGDGRRYVGPEDAGRGK